MCPSFSDGHYRMVGVLNSEASCRFPDDLPLSYISLSDTILAWAREAIESNLDMKPILSLQARKVSNIEKEGSGMQPESILTVTNKSKLLSNNDANSSTSDAKDSLPSETLKMDSSVHAIKKVVLPVEVNNASVANVVANMKAKKSKSSERSIKEIDSVTEDFQSCSTSSLLSKTVRINCSYQ